jgi:hypothetical protein
METIDEGYDSKSQESSTTPESIKGHALKQSIFLNSHTPPTAHDIDRLQHHIDLQDFGKNLQNAANAAFSGGKGSRYTHRSALLLSWDDEDPNLPVSLEISGLKDVLISLYDFEVEQYDIPAANSHMKVNSRILEFMNDSSSTHLKIVYYAGHGKLSNHGQLLWTRLGILQFVIVTKTKIFQVVGTVEMIVIRLLNGLESRPCARRPTPTF